MDKKRHAAYMREFYRNQSPEDRAKRALRVRAYYLRNREKILARVKERYRANPEAQKPYQKAYRAANRSRINAKANVNWHRRRANIRTNGPVERISVIELGERDRWKCGLCKKRVSLRMASIDHIQPISLGGTHTWVNVQLAHLKCNLLKGAARKPSQTRLDVT